MKYCALFSGGKDSTFAIYKAKRENKTIKCLITVNPYNDESLLYHHPNAWITKLLSKSLKIPIIYYKISDIKENELIALEKCLKIAKETYGIDVVLNGAISSSFQKNKFNQICDNLNIKLESPLWNVNSEDYLHDLLENKFVIILVGVSAMGLDQSWLGKTLDIQTIEKLKELSRKNKFNLNFEGGEAESLVIDCPLYTEKLEISQYITKWDGQKGIFEILEARLISK